VALIFARNVTGSLTGLVKKLDEATVKNSSVKMGSFVVFLGDDEDLKKKVKDLADKENIRHTILTTMSTPSGPPKYKVAKEAEITVILYFDSKVEANFTFKSGDLDDKAVDRILKDLTKILPKEKDKDKK
jgi:hypothetical protein